ncbi:MAG: cbb3-type cytochrome c oxidase subunit 3 [Tistlia sp.]|uniref:cbb3-type cytochrome oxidase subunit 3 n=1 Tax=Tistlia sp. TaxID=3057121 RepID=UPI0034A17C4D
MEELGSFLRSFWVVWLMAIFVGIVLWVYWPSRRRKRRMQDHAHIPLRDELPPSGPQAPDETRDDRRPE